MSDNSTFTFVFTDIEGSSRLWEESPDLMALALARHDTLLHDIFATHGGDVFKTMGDSVLVAFQDTTPALNGVLQAQRALLAEEWETTRPLRVRVAVHRGPAEQRQGDYFGPTLNRTSRLLSAGHGGQTLLSRAAREDLSLPESVSLRDLGERRLRDLARPERIFQLVAPGLPSDFPPLRSLEVLPNNLPLQLTSFIGREREYAEVKRLLEASRLVTLTGAGGTGKTRLSLEVAAGVLETFADGVWLVELAMVRDPALVGATAAAALGARENPERTIDESVLEFLRSKQLLLILDSCEHLIGECAQFAERLLRGAPQLRILAASREALSIAGETTYLVPSLGVPNISSRRRTATPLSASSAAEFEAVRLFVDRASAVQPSFALTDENAGAIANLCWRLDGIPLAIELAAARVKLLTVDQILSRLDDRFRLLTGGGRTALPRQQTLTALIDWSYDLLSEKERALLRRLPVFARGRTLAAIEEVCSGAGVERWEILDLLQQLIDKSLVSAEQTDGDCTRYYISESVWDYAREKLDTAGESPQFCARHLEYFMRFAEAAEKKLTGPEQVEWIEKVGLEEANIRLALEWAAESGAATEQALRLASAVERYWEVRNHFMEGRDHFAALLARVTPELPPPVLAKALARAGRLAFCQDDDAAARALYGRAMELYESLNAEREIGLLRALLGFVEWSDGNPTLSRSHFEAAAEVARAQGDQQLLATALSGLGTVFSTEGDHEKARALKEESLAAYQRTGDTWIIGLMTLSLTRVVIAQRDFDYARRLLAESISIGEKLGNEWSVPYILEAYGKIAAGEKRAGRAARLYGAAAILRERLGLSIPPGERQAYDHGVAEMKSALTPADFEECWAAGRKLSINQALELATRGELEE